MKAKETSKLTIEDFKGADSHEDLLKIIEQKNIDLGKVRSRLFYEGTSTVLFSIKW